jgi:pilus assembly protein Flp/PilA
MWNKLNSFALSLITRRQLMKEEGQALVEYGLILALISVVAIGALALVGTDVREVFKTIEVELGKAL